MTVIDVFAHILPPKFLVQMQALKPQILDQFPYMKNPLLTDLTQHKASLPADHQQVLSAVNLNPEDFFAPEQAADLCRQANAELAAIVRANRDVFPAGVAMLPMNNVPAALQIIDEQVAGSEALVGVQLFTRALGESIAAPVYQPIFTKLAEIGAPIWLHPVFDDRKPDNNLSFSWEYELTQAMNDIVAAGIFQQHPQLKIIVHHAGAMIPYFSQRIKYIQSATNYADFQKFYVDTAILGNPQALDLAAAFFGADHVLFGTDSPFGIPPVGPTAVIETAVKAMAVSPAVQQQIFSGNWLRLSGQKEA
ncbi:MAG: amidohydrolase [Levilactobacillus sp.]|jgi:predicted TIM-barrel fold metal-dependent hydrolase|uniref:amidohydrolase family protein n=1 Tax=Levilactobacillus sp. TaxID=2767919 RepID=UPI002586A835|nr:amidohydrolase family protein [Levilactobacillus sp.]MCI1553459.1 amidohydrolase [Levilactobacillus sp.]MCI1597848.1 amidohydrolase [Levilactobacillus sp.]MCI1605646.1 amidohydrolase [Levilactobacillus sp.]